LLAGISPGRGNDDAEDKKRYTLLIDANGQGVVKQGIETLANWFQDFRPQWVENSGGII